jgi:hypothetical protein
MVLSVPSSAFVALPSGNNYATVTAPSGTTAGDILVAWMFQDNDGSLYNMSAPQGWTLEASAGGGIRGYGKVWRKTAGSSEPGSYTFGTTSVADTIVTICRVTGITDPNDLYITALVQKGAAGLSHPSPALFTSETDGVYIAMWSGVVAASNTWGIPAGFTNRGPAALQTSYGQAVVASRTVGSGTSGPYTATTTTWNAGVTGDIDGAILIAQSASGTAGASLSTTAGMTATGIVSGGAGILPSATYQHLVDWGGDGLFTDTGDDVSARVDGKSAYTIRYGRDQARALSPIKPGTLSGLRLENSSRDYSPDNASSPLAGKLNPARPNKIIVVFQSVTYVLWQGHFDDFDLDATPGNRYVSVSGLDALADLSGAVNTPLYEGIRSGDVVHRILDAIGWPSDLRDIDPGVSVFRYWWEDGADAWTALDQVIKSEGPPAFITVDAQTGSFVYRDRSHRLTYPASTTVQATFRDKTTDPRFSWPLGYSTGWKDVINSVSFSVAQRAMVDPGVVWETDSTFIFSANEVKSVIASANEPFKNAITPVAGTDYYLNNGSINVSISRTSGGSTQILLQETGGSTAMITGLKLRANSVPVATTVTITSTDSVSIGAYGVKTYPEDAPWASGGDAQAVADIIVAARAQRLPTVQVRLEGGTSTILTQQLSRDLSDRVHVTDTETGVNADFHVEQIEHVIHGSGNKVHMTTLGCEKVGTTLDAASTVFRFGSSTNGKFGTNLFGH